jgi:hypothetical protein
MTAVAMTGQMRSKTNARRNAQPATAETYSLRTSWAPTNSTTNEIMFTNC